eukprot:6211730-Pleurochrysis_carterae.AAC.1
MRACANGSVGACVGISVYARRRVALRMHVFQRVGHMHRRMPAYRVLVSTRCLARAACSLQVSASAWAWAWAWAWARAWAWACAPRAALAQQRVLRRVRAGACGRIRFRVAAFACVCTCVRAVSGWQTTPHVHRFCRSDQRAPSRMLSVPIPPISSACNDIEIDETCRQDKSRVNNRCWFESRRRSRHEGSKEAAALQLVRYFCFGVRAASLSSTASSGHLGVFSTMLSSTDKKIIPA